MGSVVWQCDFIGEMNGNRPRSAARLSPISPERCVIVQLAGTSCAGGDRHLMATPAPCPSCHPLPVPPPK